MSLVLLCKRGEKPERLGAVGQVYPATWFIAPTASCTSCQLA